MSASLSRYWHTVRHLRPVQLYGRVLFHLRHPTPDLRPAPEPRAWTGRWVTPPEREPSLLGPGMLRLLGRDGAVRSATDWNASGAPKLWLYNLHYFDDLVARGGAGRRIWQHDLVARWMADNPPAAGNGWESYPTSLRIVNWVKWAQSGASLPPGFAESLAVQTRWLSRRIEHHLLANHLFVNAKALVVAGTWFAGAEAATWRDMGLRIITRELPAQLHADGGHVEGSPMYHALFLEDLLDLINVADAAPGLVDAAHVAAWRSSAARMLRWLRALTHPDGEIAFFNDAATGVAPAPAAMVAYAQALAVPSDERAAVLDDSGYVRLERGDAVVLADIAPVAVDYQPAHAHADTLSFEWSIGTHRVVVNGGTSTYDVGATRTHERSTAAHSTVEIDGQDSTEVWGAFRVARRARPSDRFVDDTGPNAMASGTHDGYARLPGSPSHARQWRLGPGRLEVTDRVRGAHRAVARFHLHPAVEPVDGDALRLADGRLIRWRVTGGSARVQPSTWSPAFGRSEPSRCLEVVLSGTELRTEFSW